MMEDLMEDILTSPQIVKNCIGWTFSPFPQVGSPVGTLLTTPTSLDNATKVGCETQSYTWNCISRCYVGGAYISNGNQAHQPARQVRDTEIIGDIATTEELAQFSPAQKILYQNGLEVFIRGKGLMSRAQLLKDRHQNNSVTSKIEEPGSSEVHTRSRTLGTTTTEEVDTNIGFYYSDIVPVRSLAVTTMISRRETEPMPYSPQYQILADRLNDPAQKLGRLLSNVVGEPNVMDATPMSSLVKALSSWRSTRYEIAAMVRCGAMAMSVAEESFSSDPVTYRFVRKPITVSGIGLDILQKPGTNPASWQAIAMPLDSFVALLNSSYATTVSGFSYAELDVNWTAVPVPSILIGYSHLLAYIFSFLSSDAWSGTTSYYTATTRRGPANKTYNVTETYLPVVNNINIPGVKKVCLVLIDETSSDCPSEIKLTLRDISVSVPVWKGPMVNSVSIWNLWEKFWNKDNIPGIRRDTILAYSEICTRLGVSDACGIGLSLLAELYGQWYYGIAPQNMKDVPKPDYSQAAYGAWTYDGSSLDKTNMIKSDLFNLDQADKLDARRRTMAYNFSGISPQHIFPTGVVRMRYMEVGTTLRMSWSTQAPEVAVPSYNIQTMNSVSRVATALGLIMTHTESYRFASPTGFVHWVHMLACAISFSTSAFLTINDITPKDWAEVYNKYDLGHRKMLLNTLKSSMSGDILIPCDIECLYMNISEWLDPDIMADYWGLLPYSNINWMTFGPVPSHCTQQWIEKIGLTGGAMPKEMTTFMYKNRPYMGIKLSKTYNEHKMNAVATIDAYRYFPQVLVRKPGEGYVPILHWIDNVAGYSNSACENNTVLAPTDVYESLTFCAGESNIGIPYSELNSWNVIGSDYAYSDPARSTYVTPIQWPNSPLLDTLWQDVKNYVLTPAASALASFLTGEPAGAAVAGATH